MTCSSICRPSTRIVLRPQHRGTLALFSASLSLALCTHAAEAQIHVVTTTPGYADITRQIGGDLVTVEAVMRGPENVHNVSPTPSQMLKLKKADLWVHSGLDAEPWAPLLLKGARNPRLLQGQPAYVDASQGIALKEVPGRGGLTRALGDIHIYGNTHFATDPLNGVIIARTITEALKRIDPSHSDGYEKRSQAFIRRLEDLAAKGVERMLPYKDAPVMTYHRLWPYFLDRYGLRSVGEIEPKPGVAPGPQHLNECVKTMKAQNAKVVLVETFNSKKDADFIAERVGGKTVVMAQEVDALPEVKTYEQMIEYNVNVMVAALEETNAGAHREGTP